MSLPLSHPARRSMRKDLVRLRLAMQRQQLQYHSRPLLHPLQQLGQLIGSGAGRSLAAGKMPLAIGGALLLGFFGHRFGIFGKLARLALVLYPILHSQPKPPAVIIENQR